MGVARGQDMGITQRLSRWAPLLVLAAAPSLLLAPVFAGKCLVPAEYQNAFLPWGEWQPGQGLSWNPLMCDAVLQYYPWRAFAADSIHAGQIPLWNPYQLCGMPFLANGQSAVLYPPNALFWIMPVKYAFGWSALLHLTLAGWLTYALASRALGLSPLAGTLAGLAYQLSGFLVSWTPMTAALDTMAWIPGLLVAVKLLWERPTAVRTCLLGVVTTLTLLAGHLQFAYYGLVVAVAYGLALACWERPKGARAQLARLGLLVAGLTFGVVLAAGQLLPTLELSQVNHRPVGRSAEGLEFLRQWALNPSLTASLFTMAPFGNPSRGTWLAYPQNYAEICGTVGTATVLLAGVALVRRPRREVAFLAGVACAALLVAFATPLAALLYWCLPGFSRFAGLPRVLCLWSLAVALLGGVGLDTLRDARESGPLRKRALAATAAGLAVISVLVWYGEAQTARLSPLARDVTAPDLMLFCVTLLVCSAGVVACVRRAERWVLVALVAGELLAVGHGYNRAVAPASVYAVNGAVQAVVHYPTPRVLSLTRAWRFTGPEEAALPPNAATVLRLSDVQGYDSLMPWWAKHGAAQAAGGDPSPLINGNMVMVGERGLGGLSAERLAERGVGLILAGQRTARDVEKAGLAHRVSEAGGLALLAPIVAPRPVPEHSGPNRMTAKEFGADGSDLVRETFGRGWRVRTESGDSLTPLLDRDTGFMRVAEVEQARGRTLRLSYEPGSFAVGAFVGFVALATLAGVGSARLSAGWRR